MDIGNIKNFITANAGKGLLVGRKYSPEILTAVGVAGVVTATVLACRATLKLPDVLDQASGDLKIIKGSEYHTENQKKDLAFVYMRTAKDLGKLYGASIALGAFSISCLVGSTTISHKRSASLMAAYKTIDEGFKRYRERVIEEHGEEADRKFVSGVVVTEKETKNEDGKKVVEKVASVDPNGYSQYARFFDEGCKGWSNNAEYNLMFLTSQQNYANDQLRTRGHVFLNEVYDMLGIPRTKAGAVVGWVISKEGDNFVDFGIYNMGSFKARDFVNGYEQSILLDFNVDGVIYDLI